MYTLSTIQLQSSKKAGHLHPIPPTDIPYSVISMDFCGPFIESPRGNRFVLVISDLFTRHVTAIATPNNTAEITAITLYREVFCKYGVCSTLITDQGTHFNNHLMRSLTHLFGYNHIYSTAYHPQTNAVTERFHASTKVQTLNLKTNIITTGMITSILLYSLITLQSTKLHNFHPSNYFLVVRPNYQLILVHHFTSLIDQIFALKIFKEFWKFIINKLRTILSNNKSLIKIVMINTDRTLIIKLATEFSQKFSPLEANWILVILQNPMSLLRFIILLTRFSMKLLVLLKNFTSLTFAQLFQLKNLIYPKHIMICSLPRT